jgi:hypothetical protein
MKLANRHPASVLAFATVGILILAGLLAGCSGDYGRLKRDSAVAGAFSDNRFSSAHTFYYIGRENMPYAIVGIREGYVFASKFWKPIDPDTETFRKMVLHPYGFRESQPYGAHLLDANGNRVGIIYTAYDLIHFRVNDEKEVTVYNPYRPEGHLMLSKP